MDDERSAPASTASGRHREDEPVNSNGLWHRTLVYLGLKEEPEEHHEDVPERFVPEDDPHAEHAPARPRASAAPARPVEVAEDDGATVRPLRTGDVHVRAVPSVPVARAAVVELRGFDEVESVGARYRTGQAVLFDLTGAPTVEARRVVDFVSGLTYASRGQLTKVGGRAFLLVPDGVHLPAEERRRLADLGYRLPTGSDA
jgi:cell division inhibitor SepF